MTSINLLKTFFDMAAKQGDKPFLWAKIDGSYVPWSWNRVADETRKLSATLQHLGLSKGDRVMLVAENRPEWLISDLAIMEAGGITVPAYTTNTVDDHKYILEHSGAVAAICSTPSLGKRLSEAAAMVPEVKTLIFMEHYEPNISGVHIVSDWQEALSSGSTHELLSHTERVAAHDPACFIYTSGTGGVPKGVVLSHQNILTNVEGAAELLKMVDVDEEDVFLSFLPLSHSYEHSAGQFFPMAMGAQIYYAEGIESLSSNLTEARPTILPCVPRLYEVLRQKILTGVKRQGGVKAKLFDKAIELGSRRYRDGSLPVHLAFANAVLDKLVRKKVNERFGGRLKAMVSGGAPLNYDVGLFFVSLGLPVLQGYGQTEAAPVISANLPSKSKIDTVGPPLKGVELRIADDGEILVRGNNVMLGYWRDEEATRQTLQDGWLHTGDIGELDEDGFLKITDRKKDIIVNSGGDNISPQRVEGILLLEPEIGQVLVIGDKRPYIVALIVADAEFTKQCAKAENPISAISEGVAAAVKRTNAKLSPIERIRRYDILDEPFTVDNGMMTPTMKLRRPIIINAFEDRLKSLYRSAAT